MSNLSMPSLNTSPSHPDITPEVSEATDPTSKSLTVDRITSSPADAENLLFLQKNYPNAFQMEKHLSMKLIFLHVRAYSINMSLILVRNS